MGRARLVLALLVVSLCALHPHAQTAAPTPDGWVVLPIDEYRTLRDRALPAPPPPPAPPVDATLTRVDYDLHVENDAVVGRVLLAIDVLREGIALVQLPPNLM